MPVERIAWMVAVLLCAGTAALCFAIGYSGYGWTVIAIGLAAAVNLLPRGVDGDRPDRELPAGETRGE